MYHFDYNQNLKEYYDSKKNLNYNSDEFNAFILNRDRKEKMMRIIKNTV